MIAVSFIGKRGESQGWKRKDRARFQLVVQSAAEQVRMLLIETRKPGSGKA